MDNNNNKMDNKDLWVFIIAIIVACFMIIVIAIGLAEDAKIEKECMAKHYNHYMDYRNTLYMCRLCRNLNKEIQSDKGIIKCK